MLNVFAKNSVIDVTKNLTTTENKNLKILKTAGI